MAENNIQVLYKFLYRSLENVIKKQKAWPETGPDEQTSVEMNKKIVHTPEQMRSLGTELKINII